MRKSSVFAAGVALAVAGSLAAPLPAGAVESKTSTDLIQATQKAADEAGGFEADCTMTQPEYFANESETLFPSFLLRQVGENAEITVRFPGEDERYVELGDKAYIPLRGDGWDWNRGAKKAARVLQPDARYIEEPVPETQTPTFAGFAENVLFWDPDIAFSFTSKDGQTWVSKEREGRSRLTTTVVTDKAGAMTSVKTVYEAKDLSLAFWTETAREECTIQAVAGAPITAPENYLSWDALVTAGLASNDPELNSEGSLLTAPLWPYDDAFKSKLEKRKSSKAVRKNVEKAMRYALESRLGSDAAAQWVVKAFVDKTEVYVVAGNQPSRMTLSYKADRDTYHRPYYHPLTSGFFDPAREFERMERAADNAAVEATVGSIASFVYSGIANGSLKDKAGSIIGPGRIKTKDMGTIAVPEAYRVFWKGTSVCVSGQKGLSHTWKHDSDKGRTVKATKGCTKA